MRILLLKDTTRFRCLLAALKVSDNKDMHSQLQPQRASDGNADLTWWRNSQVTWGQCQVRRCCSTSGYTVCVEVHPPSSSCFPHNPSTLPQVSPSSLSPDRLAADRPGSLAHPGTEEGLDGWHSKAAETHYFLFHLNGCLVIYQQWLCMTYSH